MDFSGNKLIINKFKDNIYDKKIIICGIDNKTTIELTDAPNTFRIPTSLVFCSAVYEASPNNPRQEMKMAIAPKILKSCPSCFSDRY